MHLSVLPLVSAPGSHRAAVARPPGHVRRWTGRVALTVPLPSLASQWLSSAPVARETPSSRPGSGALGRDGASPF